MKDGPAHPQCPLSGPQTLKWPHPHLDSSCLVEDVKEILQRGDSQGGVRAFQCESEAAVKGADWSEVPQWYPGP